MQISVPTGTNLINIQINSQKKKMKVTTFDRVAESVALTAGVLNKADSVFPHQRHEIEKRLRLKHGAFSRMKKGN